MQRLLRIVGLGKAAGTDRCRKVLKSRARLMSLEYVARCGLCVESHACPLMRSKRSVSSKGDLLIR